MVDEGSLKARRLRVLVLDPSGASISGARVQVQRKRKSGIFREFTTGEDGMARVLIPAGRYWLGISSPGFNLHYWDLTIRPFGFAWTNLRIPLSLGT